MPPPGRQRRQLNPAFASAHGLQQQPLPSASRSRSGGGGRRSNRSTTSSSQQQPNKLDLAIRSARSTGRLNLSSCNLTTLPQSIFDLRSGIEIDLSLDSTSNPGSWQSYGTEEVTTLDISDNEIICGEGNHLDQRIEKFVSIKSLRARRSNLVNVPWDSLGRLDNLLILDLSGNSIQIGMLEYLPMTVKEVDLSSNGITRLTEQGGNNDDDGKFEPAIVLPHLVTLDVSRNKLTELPSSMEVPSLQTLRFGENNIASLPLDLIVQSSRSLSTLEGPDNKLRSVPDLFGCKRLQIVDLSDNLLTDVPAVNPSLIRLSLNNNAITSLDAMFSGAQLNSDTFRSDMAELRLRGNKLSELEEDIMRCLTKAALIDVGQNDLRDLPRVLGYLPELRRIPLDGNALRVIRAPLASNTAALKDFLRKRGPPPPGPGYLAGPDPAANGSGGGSAPLPTSNKARNFVNSALVGTHTLDISGKHLQSLPEELKSELLSDSTTGDGAGGTMGGLIKKLNVSKNVLKMLDDWLQVLPRLTCIDAAQNEIESIPSFIDNIPLAELRLARNHLTSMAIASSPTCCIDVSDTLSSIAMSLAHLDLSGNRLEWFPSGLSKLPALSSLILASNGIQTLVVGKNGGMTSGWQKGFPALETLNLSSNKLTDLGDLPRCLIECCPMLRYLSLQNNELTSIPPTLGMLRSLTSIDLRGNPQRSIRLAILDRSCTEILAYLRSRMDEAELREMEARETVSSQVPPAGSTAAAAAVGGNQKVEELKKSIQDIAMQLNNVHLTEAKKYAMKKSLAMHKANLIKEERRLRMQAGA